MNEDKYATRWRQAAAIDYSLKGRVKSSLRHVALTAMALFGRPFEDRFLRCLYCHYVFDDLVVQFENMITKLKAIGTFIDTDTCIDMLEGRREIDNKYFHLSFDDGFRNVFTNAFPVLKQHNVPAIFFVPSSLVNGDWKKAKHYCLDTTRYPGIIEMVRWDDLAEMVSAGYEIGSHTRNHARLSNISQDLVLLEAEIVGSKKDIEERLGIECKYISWPYGTWADVDKLSLEMVKKAGYHACFGAFRGSVIPNKTGLYSIPRHHFELEWPLSHIKFFAKGNLEFSK